MAKDYGDDNPEMELSFLWQKVLEHEETLKLREKVRPIKSLLIELEEIIGNECYNENIQNYSSWGNLNSAGRGFRYPVTFSMQDGKLLKEKRVSNDKLSEELMSGRYTFGANNLNIYLALYKVINYLKINYGLDLDRKLHK